MFFFKEDFSSSGLPHQSSAREETERIVHRRDVPCKVFFISFIFTSFPNGVSEFADQLETAAFIFRCEVLQIRSKLHLILGNQWQKWTISEHLKVSRVYFDWINLKAK